MGERTPLGQPSTLHLVAMRAKPAARRFKQARGVETLSGQVGTGGSFQGAAEGQKPPGGHGGSDALALTGMHTC